MPHLGPSLTPSAPPIQVIEKRVLKLLLNLNPYTATCSDKIISRILKEMAASITPALTFIFQASLNQGQTPDDWKGVLVAPLFKKVNRSTASNYRTVSFTSICCKVLGHIVQSHLITVS